jgi:Chromo (CHRromatin Organisation MOdifier) domain
MKIHNVFHVDLLIPYTETEAYGETYTQPSPEIIDGEEEYEVKEIITNHLRNKGRTQKKQYLVKWIGYPASKNT